MENSIKHIDKATFLKAQGSSLISSLIDYLVSLMCHYLFMLPVTLAAAVGTISGGITNFTIGRLWTFNRQNSQEGDLRKQAFRYILVWLGNLGLVTLGVYVVSNKMGIELYIAKPLVSLIIGFTYNYGFQKYFVFK